MPQFFKLPIKVKPHIAKYMQVEHGDHLKITYYNPLSMLIYAYLQKKTIYLVNKKDCSAEEMRLLTGTLVLKIPSYQKNQAGIFLNDKHHILINNYLEQFFIDKLLAHCNMPIHPAGYHIKQSIIDFCSQYNIIVDEDINYKTILESFKRKQLRDTKNSSFKLQREKPIVFE